MELTKPQVQHISELSGLSLSDEEVEKFRRQLSSILEYVELLNEVDTADVETTAQTTGLKNIAKKDSPFEEQQLTQEEVLGNALERQDGHIKTEFQMSKSK